MSLSFLGELHFEPLTDLLNWDEDSVPQQPGVYVLASRAGACFVYPQGKSRVFYIGQAKGVRGRLERHRLAIRQAIRNHNHTVFRPMLEYGAKFGVRFSIILARRNQSPKELEDLVMALFARRYRSLPVANGAGSWTRICSIIESLDKQD